MRKRNVVLALAGAAVVVAGLGAVAFGQHFGGPRRGHMGAGGEGMEQGGWMGHRKGPRGGMAEDAQFGGPGVGFMEGEHRGRRMGMRMGGMGGGAHMKRLDTNNDGAITPDEFVAPSAARFARLDKANKGFIEAADLEAAAKERTDQFVKRFMWRFDTNSDGKVGKEEFQRASERGMGRGRGPGMGGFGGYEMFTRLDRGNKGHIEAADLEAQAKDMVAHRVRVFLKRFDTNKDGKVSKEEFQRFARERFATHDLDDDGRITDKDLPPMLRGRGILK